MHTKTQICVVLTSILTVAVSIVFIQLIRMNNRRPEFVASNLRDRLNINNHTECTYVSLRG